MKIIASDLEGTLTTGRTWQAVADYFAKHGSAWRYRRNFWWRYPIVAASKLPPVGKRVDVPALQRQWMIDLLTLFAGTREADFADIAAWVVDHHLWKKRREDVLEHLQTHLEHQANTLVIASGAYQPIVQAFADRLGADAIGTPLELTTVNGERVLTGKTAGAINTADSKRTRLEQYLHGRALDIALGDTGEDIPMLTLSQHAIAAYPDKTLTAHAVAKGWQVLSQVTDDQ